MPVSLSSQNLLVVMINFPSLPWLWIVDHPCV
jgi:hypothetical protein